MPVFVNTSSAYLPAGTLSGSPTAIWVTLSLFKSSKLVISTPLASTRTKEFSTKSLVVSSSNNP